MIITSGRLISIFFVAVRTCLNVGDVLGENSHNQVGAVSRSVVGTACDPADGVVCSFGTTVRVSFDAAHAALTSDADAMASFAFVAVSWINAESLCDCDDDTIWQNLSFDDAGVGGARGVCRGSGCPTTFDHDDGLLLLRTSNHHDHRMKKDGPCDDNDLPSLLRSRSPAYFADLSSVTFTVDHSNVTYETVIPGSAPDDPDDAALIERLFWALVDRLPKFAPEMLWYRTGTDVMTGDGLGSRVEISDDGTRMVARGSLGDSLTMYVLSNTTQRWETEFDFGAFITTKSDVVTDVALSADGLTMIAGDNYTDSSTGAVLVFRNTNNVDWLQQGTTLYGEAADDWFGAAVDVARVNDEQVRIVAGAHHGNYVKVLDWDDVANDWTLLVRLDGSDGFGRAVAVSADGGRRLVVGAPLAGKSYDGAVYFYDLSEDKDEYCTQEIVGEKEWDQFGSKVTVSRDGSRVAVGAAFGLVNVYKLGLLKRKYRQMGTVISAVREKAGVLFELFDLFDGTYNGYRAVLALSPDGTTLAVGDPYDDEGGTDAGRTDVYDLSGNVGRSVRIQRIGTFFGSDTGDNAGAAVALSRDGGLLAVGAAGSENANVTGYVRVFESVS